MVELLCHFSHYFIALPHQSISSPYTSAITRSEPFSMIRYFFKNDDGKVNDTICGRFEIILKPRSMGTEVVINQIITITINGCKILKMHGPFTMVFQIKFV